MNGPKVECCLSKIRLYAGNSEYPLVLETSCFSNNPRGADNQQERLTLRGQNPQRLYAEHLYSVNEDIVPSAWRHAGAEYKIPPACNPPIAS